MNLKDMIKDDKKVHFKFFRGNTLFYETEDGFLFEVPANDIGTGIMNRDDKAIVYMRWIRKQLDANEKAKQECLASQKKNSAS